MYRELETMRRSFRRRRSCTFTKVTRCFMTMYIICVYNVYTISYCHYSMLAEPRGGGRRTPISALAVAPLPRDRDALRR